MSSSPFPVSSSYYAFPPCSSPTSPNPSTSPTTSTTRSNTSSRPRPSLALSSISTTPSNREAIKSKFEPILFAPGPTPIPSAKSILKSLFRRRASKGEKKMRSEREKSPTPSELSEEEVEVIREMWEDWVARF